SWSQQDKKLGENSYDLFGQAVSVFGDTALVGAPGVDTTPGFEDGQAYVYERQGSSWSLDAFLTHPGGVGGDFFGAAVALGEDRALVGAPGTNTAYVFERSASAGASVASVQVISPWNQTALLKAADADGHDSFGCPLALSGDTALIGAPGDDTPGGEAAGTAFVFVHGDDACCGTGAPSESGGWCQQARLSLGDGAVDDFFGRPVALDGNTAAVGAQGDDTAAGVDTGTVYIFVRAGTVWTNQARLVALDAVSYSGFGRSLAVLGNTVLAGAPDANNQTGCAYVFIRTGTLWAQAAKLTGKSGAEGDSFGRSVTLSGNTAAIGAFGDTTPAGQAAGSVYVFTGAASKWVQQAQLMASDAAAFDLFGQSVSMSGQTLLVGAMGDDATAAGEERGCAYVFLRVGKVWGQQAKLVPDDVANMDYVGHSVSLFGNVALVGSDGADLPGQANAGAAYVFERSGASWTQQTKLTASGGAASDGFGIYVALNDGLALIGAPGDDTGAGMDAGSAYLFAENSSGLWTQQAQLTAGIDGAAGDFFGGAVALSPTIALVGASLDDGVDVFGDVAMNRGSVYVFSLLDTTPPEIAVQQPLGTGLTDGQMTPVDFGEVVVGMKGALVFKIINEGGTTLSGIKITIDGANKAEFKVVTAPPLTLAAKGEMTFSVTFGPTATGLRVAALHIASNDSDENPFDIILNGTGLPPVAPTISELQDLLVPVGAGVKFAPKVTGLPPPVIVWRRNGAVVANAKTAILALRAQLTSTGVTNAGLYLITATNSAGSASQSAELGVVDTSSKTLILPTGATATMVVRSAGNGLTHSWLMDNLPLMLDSRITTSANGKTLTIKNLVLDDAALYACLVTGPGGELLGGFHQLIVIDEHPMILEPVYMPNGIVGGAYKFTIPVDSDPIRTPTSYGATGLPAGLSVNPVTGVISGRPTVSGLFNVMLSASNFWGKATVSTSLYISPLPSLGCGAVGTFNGLVNRDGGVNGGFGGTLVLTTVAKGTFTGQLGLAGVKYPFSGSMVIADKGFPHAKVVVSRASSSLGPVILEFSLDDYEGILDGTITDKAVFPYQISDLAGSPLVPDYADGTGIQARFNGPQGIARDKAGNLYVADKNNHVIRKITPAGVVTTIGGKAGFCGSTDGPLAVALFNCPQGVAVDAAGNIYVADSGNMVIRKISPAGIVSTVAGSAGISGSVNGTGAAARFVCPISIVVDSAGNLFVCYHEDHTIRKNTPAGVVTTFAGKS
ncbi:MAG: choice-of-anchor D domain-containing protein, partial [Prosthecobacter sp.]|nr:choice-of-anchor D domain-containing protein [Prosthecobacter sp.]